MSPSDSNIKVAGFFLLLTHCYCSLFLIIFHSSLQLLCKDQEERTRLVSDIRRRDYFKGIDWADLEEGKSPSPLQSATVSRPIILLYLHGDAASNTLPCPGGVTGSPQLQERGVRAT